MNWIKKKFSNLKNWIKSKKTRFVKKIKSIDVEVRTAFKFSVIALFVVVVITFIFFRYKNSFFENILVEAHGMVFDLLIIATFLFWLQTRLRKKRTRQQNIKRWLEEIDDFRGWDEKEATFRIVGNIKRLNKIGVTRISLYACFLDNASLEMVHLEKSNLYGASLRNIYLRSATLTKTIFAKTNLWKADLSQADLSYANFNEANLRLADIDGAVLYKTNFKKADLRGIKNLTIEQLSKAKTLYRAKIDFDLKKKIENKYPHLLEKPNDYNKETF